jgi:perosamine synthetase
MYAVCVQPEFGCSRDELMQKLAENGIETRTFFCPMNQQPFLRKMRGWRDVPCPVADSLWQTGMYLPSSLSLTRAQVREICNIIKQAQS